MSARLALPSPPAPGHPVNMMKRHIQCLATALLGAAAVMTFQGGAPVSLRAQSSDPCATTPASAPDGTSRASLTAPGAAPKTDPLDHDDRWSHLDSLWAHRAALMQRRVTTTSVDGASVDLGDVAVLQDDGDLMIKANPLDLMDAALRFAPNRGGGYDVSPGTFGFRQPLGTTVTLADDDTQEIALPFSFTFFGRTHSRVFVNSDGNLTFLEADTSSTERSISRLLTGPPRVAPFFVDLDPSTGGRVVTSSEATAFNVTWCGVREYGTPRTATIQVTLFADGAIEVHVSSRTTVRDVVIGLSPGNTSDFVPVDLTSGPALAGGSSAVGERFTTTSNLDTVGVARRFLATHPDEFDNIIIFTDTELLTSAFAYEISVANGIRGLNLPVFDHSGEYGSAGRLQSVCNMDALAKYPDDPRARVLGENSTLSVLGQEVGHRWLAFLEFRDHNARRSTALLGRDNSHWSFFFDSDASVLEGNDIVDLGGGSFRTAAAVERYSLLDQYAMGLVDQTQVPPFFYVQSPTSVEPRRTATSSPQVGVTFTGTRRNVTIDDVIAIVGPRVPSAADSPRDYRQAFVYVASAGRPVEAAAIEKLDRIRVAWDQFFSAATDSRMRADTRLTRSSATGVSARANR